MIDTQRIYCLKKFVHKYSSPWKHFLSHMLKNQGRKLILHCNFSVTDLLMDIPKFYLDCFAVWCKLVKNNISTKKQIVSEILWNNRYLRISNNTVYSEKLISKGILRIGDILSVQRNFNHGFSLKRRGLF